MARNELSVSVRLVRVLDRWRNDCTNGSFSTTRTKLESVVRYIARVGPSVHKNVQSYCEATDLLSTDSTTAIGLFHHVIRKYWCTPGALKYT